MYLLDPLIKPKERPILFSAPMVRALLAGTKTQTRRAIKPQPDVSIGMGGCTRLMFKDRQGRDLLNEAVNSPEPHTYLSLCPYGQPGDRLWVRETWDKRAWTSANPDVAYRATMNLPLGKFGDRWIPSIHMPRVASRILLEVTGLRIEPLQAISEADAMAEGVELWRREEGAQAVPHGYSERDYYRLLWERINGPGSWDANPWVWVVEFQRLKL